MKYLGSGATSPEDVAGEDRHDEHGTNQHDCAVCLDTGKGQTVFQRLDETKADDRSEDRAAATEDRGAAQHHGRDGIKFDSGPHVRTGVRDPRDEDHCGDRGGKARQGIEGKLGAFDAEAGEPAGGLVGADGVDGAAP